MKLTTRLFIVIAIVTLFAILAAFMLESANRQVDEAFTTSAVIDQTVGGMVELSILTSDYLLSPSDRAISQWLSKHDTLVRSLNSIIVDNGEQQELLQGALDELENIQVTFNQLIENKQQSDTPLDVKQELDKRLTDQISIDIQRLLGLTSKLKELNQKELDSALSQSTLVNFGLLALLFLTILIVYLTTHFSILRPIVSLTQIAETISQGKLNIEFPETESENEIGILSRAFHNMTSQLRNTLQERENMINELEASNAELTQFTYTVSHDLKSPLVTINGYLGYLEQDASSGNMDRLKKDSQRIQEAVNKMHTLLTELLELSRIGRLINDPENVPFEELILDAQKIVQGQLDKHKITVQLQPNLPIVHVDRQRLTTVLQNLIENAAKHMGDQADPLIEIGQQGNEDGESIFFVRDNGIGIAPEYHERIFGLFNKLDAQSEGTGIGLALVKRIIEVYSGRIWVESELGKGSIFYFTLPSAQLQNQRDGHLAR